MNKTPLANIISVHSAKGGTGKTSIVANLAAYLAAEQHNTLVVDLDIFTRGLTFFLSHGQLNFAESVTAERILEGRKNWIKQSMLSSESLLAIRDHLYLMPATNEALATSLLPDMLDAMPPVTKAKQIVRDIRNILNEIIKRFNIQHVFIDARSGIDFWSLVPSLVADQYWVVTEEDRTSQRASRLLLDQVNRFKKDGLGRNGSPKFSGFILNMTVTSLLTDLVSFFERTVFGKPCIAAIPLSRQVRRAFVRDELVIERHKGNAFSKEIKALGDELLNRKTRPTLARVQSMVRQKFLFNLIPAGVVSGALISLAFDSFIGRWSSTVSIMSLALAGLVLVVAFYYYQRGD